MRTALRTKISVLHISTSGGLALARDFAIAVIGKLVGARVILHLHQGRLPVVLERGAFESFCMNLLVGIIDDLLLLDANSAASAVERWGQEKVQVVPNPVALREVKKAKARPRKILLYLGWVTESKGVEDLLTAWTQLAPSYRDWDLDFVGAVSPGYKKELVDRFPPTRWRLLGELSHQDAMEYLASAEVLILPSHSEGFPNVILEAMLLGKAIVATRVGAIPEMLDEGGGLLTAPGAPDELCAALSWVMKDDDFRHEIGQEGKKKATRDYAATKIVEQYRRVWRI
ncbi:glycosyltransferase family 4 protein [Tessaracoccus sp. ZS01]|uniref:glycosyltransferase family 4 protein n=1 Tax=Tessaracoccus sp. ZS01 TaxID=1906324 RepID=UPI00096C96F9|nr:glycosyltransferase family 4 protein [Tessaracoccus sp. ZS01]OMG54144.1 hypothetical protein BJN44_10620 [Tessaracoccus sp. ZS01]